MDFDSAKIAVRIPCYNEGHTISEFIKLFKETLPYADVYIFNNNSTDNNALLAQEAGAIVISESRQGKGNVVRSMFRQIDADAYLMVDGDNTYDASAAPDEMLRQVIEHGVDMVI